MKSLFASTLAMAIALIAAPLSQAGLDVGDSVESFAANDDQGNLWSLNDHLGRKNVVVYFYPAAMTGGCTKQACSYRDQSAALNNADALVVGVSGDSVNSLKLFKEAHGLNFPLISDPNGAIAELFGVPTRKGGSIEREIAGMTHTLTRGLTTSRWTYIIGKDGTIVYKDDSVQAADDANVVLGKLQQLASK